MKKLLVVDDDNNLRMIIKQSLESCGYEIRDARDGITAFDMMKKENLDLIITDLMMPGMDGIELLEKTKELNSEMGCLVITAYGTVEKAVVAMQKGAFDFITKPFSISHLESRIERYFEYKSLQQENKNLKRQLSKHKIEKKLLGRSPAMQDIFNNIEIVSQSDATVFIRGASGTGKELIAQAVHDGSDRAEKPFLKINCAAVPETLFESTLFGHEKGSFSGAYRMQKGIFEECDGGTLLLDEISEIPFSMQAKLLRVLQEMKIVKIGSTVEIPVDVRIITTSNRDISAMIRQGQFREDLFFRLNVFPISVPDLKYRREDIPVLVNHFFEFNQKKYNFCEKVISDETMELLIDYSWPGNVRQMEHMMERAVLVSGKESVISPKHILMEPTQTKTGESHQEPDSIGTLEEMEKQLIYATLEKTSNHRTKAANILGISVRTLRNKLNLYESNPEME